MFIKEWIELTLCELGDEISQAKNEEEIIRIIRRYGEEIYEAQKQEG